MSKIIDFDFHFGVCTPFKGRYPKPQTKTIDSFEDIVFSEGRRISSIEENRIHAMVILDCIALGFYTPWRLK